MFGFKKLAHRAQKGMINIFKRFRHSAFKRLYAKKLAEDCLTGKDFEIDPFYFESFLKKQYLYKYKLRYIPLKKIRALIYVNPVDAAAFPLECSPAYRYLLGEKKVYEDYNKMKNTPLQKDVHSNERFERLIRAMDTGIDPRKVLILRHNNELIDGQHRASYLLRRFGKNYRVRVLKLWLVHDIDKIQ